MTQSQRPKKQVGNAHRKLDAELVTAIAFDSPQQQPRRGRSYQPSATISLAATLRCIDLGVLDCPCVNQLLKLFDLYLTDGDEMTPVK